MAFLGETTLTRRRFAAPSYVAGRPVPGAATDTTFVGSVQPLNGRDRQVLPEGLRQRRGYKVYCPRTTLRTDDQHAGTSADHVIRSGDTYTVVHVDGAHPLIEHDRAYIVRVQEAE